MSTRLEEIQAAVKAKQNAGQPIFANPVQAPTVAAVTPPPTTSTIGPTLPQNTPAASTGVPAPTTGTTKYATGVPTSASAAPTTNYVANGGKTLNDILYLKDNYRADNKDYIAKTVAPLYAQLDSTLAGQVKNMSADQLRSYINSQNQQGTGSSAGTGTPGAALGMNNGVPAAPTQSADYSSIMDSIRSGYMADIQTQSLSIQQALDKAIAASQLNVNQNNNQLQEQIRSLTNQKAQLDDAAQQLQNRRGGFYSGGLDYQLGNIASTTQQATGDAQRDVATRNDSIYANNALLAQQAADTIKQLETAAPDKIRELIRQAINDERSFGLQEGALTGSYNGTPTLAAQQFQWGQQTDTANLTGSLNGKSTLAAQQQSWNQNQDTIANNANYGGTFNGNKTVQQQQQEWENKYNQSNNTFNQNVTMAQLTGFLPDGTATSAQQQLQLQNLWAVADATGTIPDSLATLYGLPKGTQTQAAYQFAQQIAISKQNADTSSNSNTNSNANSQFNQLMDIWKATGVAPAGISGVTAGTPYSTGAAAQVKAPTAESYATDYLDKAAKYDDDGALQNADAIEKSILASGLPAADMKKLYLRYGIPLPSGN